MLRVSLTTVPDLSRATSRSVCGCDPVPSQPCTAAPAGEATDMDLALDELVRKPPSLLAAAADAHRPYSIAEAAMHEPNVKTLSRLGLQRAPSPPALAGDHRARPTQAGSDRPERKHRLPRGGARMGAHGGRVRLRPRVAHDQRHPRPSPTPPRKHFSPNERLRQLHTQTCSMMAAAPTPPPARIRSHAAHSSAALPEQGGALQGGALAVRAGGPHP